MVILVIDDDKTYADPLVWMLGHIGHEVWFCKYPTHLFNGWLEFTLKTKAELAKSDIPTNLIRKLEVNISGRQFSNKHQLISSLSTAGLWGQLKPYESTILTHLKINPTTKQPDLLILDIMMPTGVRYSNDPTVSSKFTGIRVLQDYIQIVGNIPTVVITVHELVNIKNKLSDDLSNNILDVLEKPILPDVITQRLDALFPGQFRLPGNSFTSDENL